MGKDTFILTDDVKAALTHHGLTDKFSTNSKKDLSRVQGCLISFNRSLDVRCLTLVVFWH